MAAMAEAASLSRRVTVQAGAKDRVRFPEFCVNCLEDAARRIEIKKQIGQQTRLVEVPICERCQAELTRMTDAEARWRVLSWPMVFLTALLTLVLVWQTTGSTELVVRLPLLLTLPLCTAYLARRLVAMLAWRAAIPRKQQIRRAAAIVDFDNEQTTFSFTNPNFAERFERLN